MTCTSCSSWTQLTIRRSVFVLSDFAFPPIYHLCWSDGINVYLRLTVVHLISSNNICILQHLPIVQHHWSQRINSRLGEMMETIVKDACQPKGPKRVCKKNKSICHHSALKWKYNSSLRKVKWNLEESDLFEFEITRCASLTGSTSAYFHSLHWLWWEGGVKGRQSGKSWSV